MHSIRTITKIKLVKNANYNAHERICYFVENRILLNNESVNLESIRHATNIISALPLLGHHKLVCLIVFVRY